MESSKNHDLVCVTAGSSCEGELTLAHTHTADVCGTGPDEVWFRGVTPERL